MGTESGRISKRESLLEVDFIEIPKVGNKREQCLQILKETGKLARYSGKTNSFFITK